MPGIFERMSSLIRANINSILDSAEDPEKVLDQIIRDMRGGIEEARGQVAEMIARERLLQADLERNRDLASEWQRKAELAVNRGAEDLAREALRRKLDYQKNVQLTEGQWQSQHETVEKLKADLATLQSRYDQAVRQHDELIARHKAAQARAQVNRTLQQISTIDPSSELRRMEERIAMTEARAEAHGELRAADLDDKFAQLEGDDELEMELALLKAKTQPQLNASGEGSGPASS